MTDATTIPEQSGLTIDGVPIPLAVEADGPAAIAAHLAGHAPAPVAEGSPDAPTHAEGAE